MEEKCPGNAAACPEDQFKANTVVCRDAAGDCDLPEFCTGNAAACPENKFKANTVVCRAADPTNPCDLPEFCTGTSATCPENKFKANGTPCEDGNPCTLTSTCQGGQCKGTTNAADNAACGATGSEKCCNGICCPPGQQCSGSPKRCR